MTNLRHRRRRRSRLSLPPHQQPNDTAGQRAQGGQPTHHTAGNRSGITLLPPRPLRVRGLVLPLRRCRRRSLRRRRRRRGEGAQGNKGGAVESVARVDERIGGDVEAGEGGVGLDGDLGAAAEWDAIVEGEVHGVEGGGAHLDDSTADGEGGFGTVGEGVSAGLGVEEEKALRWVGHDCEGVIANVACGPRGELEAHGRNLVEGNIPYVSAGRAGSRALIGFGRSIACRGRGINKARVGVVDISITR